MDYSFSEELEAKVRCFCKNLNEASETVSGHEAYGDHCREGLFRLHCMVRATVPLLEAALARSRALAESDDVAAGLVDYLEGMIREETGHDEWALEGLQALGRTREDVMAEVPPAVVASTVGAQYYWLQHYHPVAILGYIKVVERHPSTHEEIEEAVAHSGHPKEAFVYYTRHVEIEKLHNERLDDLLDTLPLTAEHRALIGVSAANTIRGLEESLGEILALHEHAA